MKTEAQKKRDALWQKNHPKERKAIQRRYYKKNKQKLRAKNRAYARAHSKQYLDYQLRRYYGISLKEYNRLFKEQKGVCAICKKPETLRLGGKVRRLAVDHDHVTKKVRGLLCDKHNKGLGCFSDDAGLLQAGINYLRRTPRHGSRHL